MGKFWKKIRNQVVFEMWQGFQNFAFSKLGKKFKIQVRRWFANF